MVIDKLETLIGRGAQAEVYSMGSKAVKLFKEGCLESEAFCEAALQSMARGKKLPVPKIYEVIQVENKMAIVMDLVEGISMKDVMAKDINNFSVYLETIIDLQMKVHHTSSDGFPSMKEKLWRRIVYSPVLLEEQKERLLNLLSCFEIGNSLCHGDFHFLNILKTDREMVIIDWIDATSGSPEADICRTYMLYALYSPEGFADTYLDVYCRKVNKNRQDILRWLPVIAGARLFDKIDFEKEQLLQWVG